MVEYLRMGSTEEFDPTPHPHLEPEEEAKEFDMGQGGMMTKKQIEERFAELVKGKGPVGEMIGSMIPFDMSRRIVFMDLNEPSEADIQAARAQVDRRARLEVDGEDREEAFDGRVVRVHQLLEESGGKLVGYALNARIVYEDDEGNPKHVMVGGVSGHMGTIMDCLVPNAISLVESMSDGLGISWSEALSILTSKIEASRFNAKAEGRVRARAAANILKELDEDGKGIEDSPALARVLSEFLGEEFEKQAVQDPSQLIEILRRLRASDGSE